MKIEDLNQQSSVAYVASGRIDRPESNDAHSDTTTRQQQSSGDKVALSSYIPVVPTSQTPEGLRASRIQEIKSQIQDGTYEVSSTAVAEKMLTKAPFK